MKKCKKYSPIQVEALNTEIKVTNKEKPGQKNLQWVSIKRSVHSSLNDRSTIGSLTDKQRFSSFHLQLSFPFHSVSILFAFSFCF